MFDPVVDIDVREIKDSRLVVPAEDGSNRVRNIPTESWSEVVVITDDLIHLLKRDVAAVSRQDACEMSNEVMSSESRCRVYQRDKAPEWTLP